MIELPRRRFLQSAAALALAGCVAPEGPPTATPTQAARLNDIDHIIILMKENRSFDHYFGTLAGVRGFSDPNAMRRPGGGSVFEQPDTGAPSGVALPFRLDTTKTSAQRLADLNHEWVPQHACLANPNISRF
jgi:phospholipase C